MKKMFLLCTLIFVQVSQMQAMTIGLGARVGAEFSFNSAYPGDQPMMEQISKLYSHKDGQLFSVNLVVGLLADFRFSSWFSLSPSAQFALQRRANLQMEHNTNANDISNFHLRYNTLDVDLLAKFHAKWWYLGIGAGLAFYSPVAFNVESETLETDFFKMQRKMGVNVVLDSGLYIPIAQSEHHHLLLSMRTTFDVKGIKTISNVLKEAPENPSTSDIIDILGKQTHVFSPLSISMMLGYFVQF